MLDMCASAPLRLAERGRGWGSTGRDIEFGSCDGRSPETLRTSDARTADRRRAQIVAARLRYDIPLSGSHFRRQVLIGDFIVDFASRKARLAIELDGGQHSDREMVDALRTRRIEAAG